MLEPTFHPVHHLARAPFAHRLHHQRHRGNFAPRLRCAQAVLSTPNKRSASRAQQLPLRPLPPSSLPFSSPSAQPGDSFFFTLSRSGPPVTGLAECRVPFTQQSPQCGTARACVQRNPVHSLARSGLACVSFSFLPSLLPSAPVRSRAPGVCVCVRERESVCV